MPCTICGHTFIRCLQYYVIVHLNLYLLKYDFHTLLLLCRHNITVLKAP